MKFIKRFLFKIYIFYYFYLSFVINKSLYVPISINEKSSYRNYNNSLGQTMRKVINYLSMTDEKTFTFYNKFFFFDYFFNENLRDYSKINQIYDDTSNEDISQKLKNFYENIDKKYKDINYFYFSKCRNKNFLFDNSCNRDDIIKIYHTIEYVKTKFGPYCGDFYEELLCEITCGKKSNKNFVIFEDDVYEDIQTISITMNTCKNFLSKCPKLKIFSEESFEKNQNIFFKYKNNFSFNKRHIIKNKANHKKSNNSHKHISKHSKHDKNNKFEYEKINSKKIEQNEINEYPKNKNITFQDDINSTKIIDPVENYKIWNYIYQDICQNDITKIIHINDKYKIKILIDDEESNSYQKLNIFDFNCKIEGLKETIEGNKNINNEDIFVKNYVDEYRNIKDSSLKSAFRIIEHKIKNKTLEYTLKNQIQKKIHMKDNKKLSHEIYGSIVNLIARKINKTENGKAKELKLINEKAFTETIFLKNTYLDMDYHFYLDETENILKDFMILNDRSYAQIFGESPLFYLANLLDETFKNAKLQFFKSLKSNFSLMKIRLNKNFENYKKINTYYLLEITDELINSDSVLLNFKKFYDFIIEYIIFIEPFDNIDINISQEMVLKQRMIKFDYLQSIFLKFFKDIYLRNYNRYILEENTFEPLLMGLLTFIHSDIFSFDVDSMFFKKNFNPTLSFHNFMMRKFHFININFVEYDMIQDLNRYLDLFQLDILQYKIYDRKLVDEKKYFECLNNNLKFDLSKLDRNLTVKIQNHKIKFVKILENIHKENLLNKNVINKTEKIIINDPILNFMPINNNLYIEEKKYTNVSNLVGFVSKNDEKKTNNIIGSKYDNNTILDNNEIINKLNIKNQSEYNANNKNGFDLENINLYEGKIDKDIKINENKILETEPVDKIEKNNINVLTISKNKNNTITSKNEIINKNIINQSDNISNKNKSTLTIDSSPKYVSEIDISIKTNETKKNNNDYLEKIKFTNFSNPINQVENIEEKIVKFIINSKNQNYSNASKNEIINKNFSHPSDDISKKAEYSLPIDSSPKNVTEIDNSFKKNENKVLSSDINSNELPSSKLNPIKDNNDYLDKIKLNNFTIPINPKKNIQEKNITIISNTKNENYMIATNNEIINKNINNSSDNNSNKDENNLPVNSSPKYFSKIDNSVKNIENKVLFTDVNSNKLESSKFTPIKNEIKPMINKQNNSMFNQHSFDSDLYKIIQNVDLLNKSLILVENDEIDKIFYKNGSYIYSKNINNIKNDNHISNEKINITFINHNIITTNDKTEVQVVEKNILMDPLEKKIINKNNFNITINLNDLDFSNKFLSKSIDNIDLEIFLKKKISDFYQLEIKNKNDVEFYETLVEILNSKLNPFIKKPDENSEKKNSDKNINEPLHNNFKNSDKDNYSSNTSNNIFNVIQSNQTPQIEKIKYIYINNSTNNCTNFDKDQNFPVNTSRENENLFNSKNMTDVNNLLNESQRNLKIFYESYKLIEYLADLLFDSSDKISPIKELNKTLETIYLDPNLEERIDSSDLKTKISKRKLQINFLEKSNKKSKSLKSNFLKKTNDLNNLFDSLLTFIEFKEISKEDIDNIKQNYLFLREIIQKNLQFTKDFFNKINYDIKSVSQEKIEEKKLIENFERFLNKIQDYQNKFITFISSNLEQELIGEKKPAKEYKNEIGKYLLIIKINKVVIDLFNRGFIIIKDNLEDDIFYSEKIKAFDTNLLKDNEKINSLYKFSHVKLFDFNKMLRINNIDINYFKKPSSDYPIYGKSNFSKIKNLKVIRRMKIKKEVKDEEDEFNNNYRSEYISFYLNLKIEKLISIKENARSDENNKISKIFKNDWDNFYSILNEISIKEIENKSNQIQQLYDSETIKRISEMINLNENEFESIFDYFDVTKYKFENNSLNLISKFIKEVNSTIHSLEYKEKSNFYEINLYNEIKFLEQKVINLKSSLYRLLDDEKDIDFELPGHNLQEKNNKVSLLKKLFIYSYTEKLFDYIKKLKVFSKKYNLIALNLEELKNFLISIKEKISPKEKLEIYKPTNIGDYDKNLGKLIINSTSTKIEKNVIINETIEKITNEDNILNETILVKFKPNNKKIKEEEEDKTIFNETTSNSRNITQEKEKYDNSFSLNIFKILIDIMIILILIIFYISIFKKIFHYTNIYFINSNIKLNYFNGNIVFEILIFCSILTGVIGKYLFTNWVYFFIYAIIGEFIGATFIFNQQAGVLFGVFSFMIFGIITGLKIFNFTNSIFLLIILVIIFSFCLAIIGLLLGYFTILIYEKDEIGEYNYNGIRIGESKNNFKDNQKDINE